MSSAPERRRWRAGAAVVRAVRAHAREAMPRECCGFLLGGGGTITHIAAMENVADDPRRRYEIDARAHLALRRTLRDLTPAVTIIGVYHSHPAGDAIPSPADVAEAYYPDWLHLLVGMRGGRARLRAWTIANGRAREVSMGITGVAGRTSVG